MTVIAAEAQRFIVEAYSARRSKGVAPNRAKLQVAFRRALAVERTELLRRLAKLADHWPLDPLLQEDALPPSRWTPALISAQVRSSALMRDALRRYGARAVQAGAVQVAADVDVGLAFDLANPTAVQYLEDRAAALVVRINDATREALKALLVQAAAEGWSYRTTANAIRSAHAFSPARSLVIARTETTNAYAEGNLAGARELEAKGYRMEKSWLTNEPEDGECIENGESPWIPVDERFPSGDLRPPVHPNCECDLIFRRAE